VTDRPRLLPTTVVGSYPQPDWLIDRAARGTHSVPRVRVPGAWRIAEPHLHEAQDDATLVAIREMEEAGIDIVTDGEIRRESYSNRFATALEGVDADNPAVIHTRGGESGEVPRIVGPVRWREPWRRPSTRRPRRSRPSAPTSSSLTSRGCAPTRRAPGALQSGRSTAPWRG
jgi:methionine synthase II (cobalamin-independent)